MYTYYNPNPQRKRVGDCVIRAISLALGESWEDVYSDLSVKAYLLSNMPSSDSVWGAYLRNKGYKIHTLPDKCPDCYTLEDFCKDHSKGTYIVKTDNHVVTCIDGNVYDTWDSSQEVPIYYFAKE